MKKSIIVIAGVLLALLAILYFSKSGPFRLSRVEEAQAQGHQHGSPPAQSSETKEQAGSMPGMPGMPAEKPTAEAPPAPEQTTGEAPTIEISPEKQRMIGVKVIAVSVQPLTKTIRTVGLVDYDQRKLHTINAKVEGWVEKLYVNFTGSYVKKGDPVADIYSPELWATQQEFINVVKWAKGSQRREGRTENKVHAAPDIGAMIEKDAWALVEAARQRLKLWDISDVQITKIEESERPIRTLTIYSPYSGYVLQKNITQGARIMAGASLLDVADLSTVWITADIYEFEIPLINVGDMATVRLNYFPGRQFSTRIDYIYPSLEGETRL
jgi:Cu(I)/Ag(I) efflux system membrane fusion protein